MATVTATLGEAVTAATTITVSAAAGTDTDASDFTLSAAWTLTIAAGETTSTGTVTITAVDNALDEPDKSVTVSGAASSSAEIRQPTDQTLTITDDDGPTVSLDSPSVTEGDSGSTNLTFTATLSATTGQQVTVDYADATTGTATSGTDYTAITAGTLTFPVGTTSQTFDVAVTGDTLDEANETVVVSLSSATNATIATGTGTGTITDDDAATATLSINSPSVTEGDSGTTNLTFTVTLSATTGQQVTVDYADAGTGTATSGTDYTAITAGTLTFPAGTTSQTFTVAVTGDTLAELRETVVVTLSGATNATIATATGTGRITNDDAGLIFTPTALTVTEEGASQTFTVTLSSRPPSEQASISLYPDPGLELSGAGTARNPGNITFNFRWGFDSPRQITVTALADSNGNDETRYIRYRTSGYGAVDTTNPQNGVRVNVIDDDEPTVSLSLSPASVSENAGVSTVTATLNKAVTVATTITVSAAAGTAADASDFTLSAANTLAIAAGATTSTGTVTVTAVNNTLDEPDKSVTVSGTVSHNGVTAPADQTLTITDDDPAPTLSIDSPSVTEGDSGTTNLTFTATLSAESGQQVTVDYADAGTGTATSGTDYTAITGGTLTFAAGTTSQTFNVSVTGDALDEVNETVLVTLSSATNATISTATGTGTITDDETLPTVALVLSPASISESGGVSTVTATLSGASSEAVTVTVDAAAGTGAIPADFALSSATTLTIAAGATTSAGAVTVTANGNAVDAPNKQVTVSATVSGGNNVVAPSNVMLTLTDDETLPTVALVLSPMSISESGGVSTVTATLSGASSEAVTVTVDAAAGTGADAVDFTLSGTTTLTIAAGDTTSSGAVTVTANGNDVDAPDKAVTVSGTVSGGNGVATPSSVTLMLTDDEGTPTVTLVLSASSISENGGVATVTATLSGKSSAAVTLTVSTSPSPGTDFTLTGTTLTIGAGATTSAGAVTVTGVDDVTAEGSEPVTISGVAAGGNGVMAPSPVTLTLTDDDAPQTTLLLSASSIGENGGVATVTATLDRPSTVAVTVTVSAAPGSGTAFTLSAAKTLTFAATATTSAGVVTVTASNNDTDAPDKSVTVSGTASDSLGLTNHPPSVTLTITDDDAAPNATLSLNPASISENGGTSAVSATLSHPSSAATTVTVTAVSGAFTVPAGAAGTIVIAAGLTTAASDTVTITAVDNATDEPPRTATVTATLTNSQGAGSVTAVTLTLTDDEPLPTATLVLSSSSISENGGVATVTATLSGKSSAAVTLTVSTSPSPGTDFTLTGTTLTIGAGATTSAGVVTVTGVDDVTAEGSEQVTISGVAAGGNGVGDPSNVMLTLTDDDTPQTTLLLSASSISEDGGVATVTATLDRPSTVAVTLTVSASPGSGTAFTLSAATTLTFAANATTSAGVVTVTASDNDTDAPDKSVRVSGTASDSLGLTNNPPNVTLTITDDDAAPNATLSLNPMSISENGGTSAVSATLSHPSSAATTVTVTAVTGFYTVGSDATIVIAAGSTSNATDTATVAAVDDATHQGSGGRSTTVTGTAVNAQATAESETVAVTGAPLTLTDDETLPTVALVLSPASISESGGVSTVTATLSGASSEAVTVTVDAAAGTGAIPADFTLSSATTLTIAAGATTSAGAVTVTANGNAVDAPNKQVTVSATVSGGNNVVAPSNVMLTLTDDETLPTVALALSPMSISESGGVSTVTATLSGASSEAVTVTVDAAAGTGAIPADFALSSATTLTIAAGATTSAGAVTVTANGNAVDAPNKQVTVSATVSGGNNVVAPSNVMLTLTDDETLPTVALVLSPMSITESGGVSTVTATLSGASSEAVTVTVDAAAGTGAIPADFALSSATTLTIAAGDTTSAGAVTVTANGNAVDAPNKQVTVSATVSGGNGVAAPPDVMLTLTDDETLPTVALVLSPMSITESGGVSTVTATLSGASSEAVTVTVDAAAGTGAIPADFALSSATTLTIAAGDTTSAGAVTVTANGNAVDAPNKQVTVSATVSGGNGVAAPPDVTLTLTDDEGTPTVALALSPTSISESSGVSTVTATLSGASSEAVTVTVDAAAGTGAVAADFMLSSATTLTIAAGDTTSVGAVTVTANGNAVDAPDKLVTVSGTVSGGNGVAAPPDVTLTLTDDEGTPTVALALSPASISESGGVSMVTATLSGASSEAVTVTVDAAAGTGAIPADFALSSATTLTIAAGATTSAGAVTVTANGNAVDAPNKQVTVSATVSGGNNVVAPSNVMLTLTDDETLPTVALALSPASISESGGVSTVTATLSGASSEAVTVTVDAAAGTGAIPADFALSSATTLTIAAGDTTSAGAVTVTANGNDVDAPDKAVTVSGTVSGGNGVATPSSVTLMLTDDEGTPTVTLVLSASSISENGGVATVTATLSGKSSAAVTLTVSTSPSPGTDFTLTGTTLTIGAGATTSAGAVTVTGADDGTAEGSEQVTISGVAAGGNGVGNPAPVMLTLTDDDTPQTTLLLSASSISEDGGVATVTATLDRPSTVAVTLTVSASPGSGTAFTLSAATTLTFAANATTSAGVVTVTASDNDTDAPDKSVRVSGTASDSLGLTNHPDDVTLTITDDDAAPNATLSLSPASISENGGTSAVSATLSHPSSAATTVTVTAVSGAFTVPAGAAGTIVIAAGSTTAASDTVTITAVDNATDEPDRMATVTATLTNSQGAGSVTAVTLTLEDDDAAPGVTLVVSPASVSEDGGVSTVTATLSHPSSAVTTVTVTPVANAYSVASGSGATIVVAAGATTSTDTATITAEDNDVDAADNPVTVSGTAQNGQGVGTVSGALLTITDDDDAGLVVSPATSASSRLRTTESAGTDTFTVKLATKPTGDVVLGVASSNTAEGTVSASSLTFTATTWNTAQTVTLTGVDDAPTNPADGNQNYTVTLTTGSTGTDTNYNALSSTVYAVNADNEYGLDVSSRTVQVTEGGGTATFTVALFTQPLAAVTVTVTSENTAEGTVSPSLLVFTMGTWNTAQPVVVTAVDDDVHGGNVSYNVVLAPSSTDSNYNTLTDETVSVTTTDNDAKPTVMLAVTPATITENGGVATVTATLSGKSSQAVTLTVTTTPVPTPGGDFTKTGETLTIAAEQTTSTGLVTVTAKNNDVHSSEDKAVMISATAPGSIVADPDPVTLTITDDDKPGLEINKTELALKEEATDPADMESYTVKLETEPTAAVTVTVTVTVVNGHPGAVMVAPTTLTFTGTNWATAQPVTVTAGRDPPTDYQNEKVTLTHTASGASEYGSLPAAKRPSVTVEVEDKDPLPRLQAGADTTINDHRVTVTATRAEATPAVEVIPSAETDGDIEVKISLYEGDPNIQMPDGGRFFLGSSDQPMDRTAVDITVTSEGRPLTDATRARVLGDGLTICLPVSKAVRDEARELGRDLYLLHNRHGAWTVVGEADVAAVEAQGNRLCVSGLLDFSPFVVAIDRGKEVTFEPDAQQSWTFLTGQAVRDGAGALPGATGDGRITYTLTPITLPLPAGLTYTPPGAGAEHGGTITGTPTTPTAPREYTLTATDVDKEKVSHPITIEVKPGIQSRDLGLVLAGVGRTLASDAVEILGGRFGSSPASRLQVTLGGQVLRLTNPQSPSPSSPPSPLAGEGQGEGGLLRGEGEVLRGEGKLLQGEGSLLQGEATRAVPVGASPWQQATGLALSVARALGVTINTPSPHSPSPLAGAGRGEGGVFRGQGGFLQNEPNRLGRLPTDLRRGTTTSSLLGLQPVSGRDLLARSAFELPLTRTGDHGVPAWTLWGRGSAAGFSGQPEAGFKMDGTLYSGYVGVDYRPQATVLMGLAVAHSTGDVNYERTEATKAGADVELTSVLPYAHWQPRPGLGVWGLAGAGWGEMDLKLVGDAQTYTTRLTSWLGAVGGRQALTTWQGIDLAAKTDAFLTTVRSAGKTNLPAARGHAQRVRLVVEGRTAVDLSPVSRLEPRLELGGRWDNGTAEQGLGSELGGGVAYTRTDWGLSVDAQGRYLLLHEDGAFEDWGASVSVRLDPGVAGEGAYLTVAPVWGQASSGVEQLWGTAAVLPQARGPSQPATGWQPGSLEVDIGYGVALADGRGLVTPYGGLALAGTGSSRYRLGSRLALSSSLDVTLEGERAEQPGQKTAHGVLVRLGWQW